MTLRTLPDFSEELEATEFNFISSNYLFFIDFCYLLLLAPLFSCIIIPSLSAASPSLTWLYEPSLLLSTNQAVYHFHIIGL